MTKTPTLLSDKDIIANMQPIMSFEEIKQVLADPYLSRENKRVAETAFLLFKIIKKLKGEEP